MSTSSSLRKIFVTLTHAPLSRSTATDTQTMNQTSKSSAPSHRSADSERYLVMIYRGGVEKFEVGGPDRYKSLDELKVSAPHTAKA